MINSIINKIKSLINEGKTEEAKTLATRLPNVYINFPDAQELQVWAINNNIRGFGHIEKFVGFNIITLEEGKLMAKKL